MATGVTVGLLGPVTLRSDGRRVLIQGQRQVRLLATLALQPGQVVSKSAIIEDSWGPDSPKTVTGQIQNSVWMIRSALKEAGVDRDILASHHNGYQLDVLPQRIDLFVFRTMIREVRELMKRGTYDEAALHLDTALELWKGPALSDVVAPVLRNRAAVLDGERAAAQEIQAQLGVLLGRYDEAISQLEDLIEREPLREDLRVSLMHAYYGVGRQADALDVYHRAKEVLIEQIGIRPGRQLREAMHAVLHQNLVVAGSREKEGAFGGRSAGR
ncbi:BTAD domain-containing putative transcriptional regulator [Kitasatospora albolonga]